MNRHALAIRHVGFEDLGLLEPLLERHGYRIDYLDVGTDTPAPEDLLRPELLIVLGGPIGVHQDEGYPFLTHEVDGLRRRLADGRAMLGICLGAQLMARALGAPVSPSGHTEIGYAPLTLTEAGASSVLAPLAGVPVLHWHGDEYAIPEGGTRLASTPGCANQAFHLQPHMLGLQFHLEADYRRIESWLIGHAHELASANIDPAGLRADAATHGPALARASTEVLNTWLDHVRAAL